MASHILSSLFFFVSTYLSFFQYMHTYPPPTADSTARFIIYTHASISFLFLCFGRGKGRGKVTDTGKAMGGILYHFGRHCFIIYISFSYWCRSKTRLLLDSIARRLGAAFFGGFLVSIKLHPGPPREGVPFVFLQIILC